MPRSFTDKERQKIDEQLKAVARAMFSQYGIKKTTVDEIVKRVNIPKGTFYLFYASKEMLLYEVVLEEQAKIQNELIDTLSKIGPSMSKSQFSQLIFDLFKKTTRSFLFPLLTSGDYELLLRKLPQEALERNIQEDDQSIERLFSLIPGAQGKDLAPYSGALRGIVLMMLHKSEIGENIFDETIKLLIDGITEKIFE